MSDFFANVFFAAFKDGFTPNMIMVGAVVIALYLFQWYKGFKVSRFVSAFIVQVLFFEFLSNLDLFMATGASRIFSLLYDLIAGAFLVTSAALLLEWGSHRGEKVSSGFAMFAQNDVKKLDAWKSWLLVCLAAVLAVTLTVKDKTWPIDPYIAALSNNIYGMLLTRLSILSVSLYMLLKFWMVWLVVFVFSLTILDRRLKIMIAAAFFLAAGSTLFYVK